MSEHWQLAVVGAGPAGLAAATTAAELGIEVVLIDEQPDPGGRIYQKSTLSESPILGDDYARGVELADAFRASGAGYRPDTDVWLLDAEREIGIRSGDTLALVSAERVLVASGAMERPLPFPGWTLPGVMTAGAGQILLKSAAVVPAGRVVLAGSGPLLFLLASQYLRAGVHIAALLDTTPAANYLAALPHLPAALVGGDYLAKGLAMKREITAAGVEVVGRVRGLKALGEGRLEAVEYQAGGSRKTIETELLLTHFGLVPNTAMADAAGCSRVWNEAGLSWQPTIDAWGNTDVEGIAVAGDCAGIGGARAAERSGRLAALEAARALGLIDAAGRDRRAAPERKALARELRARPFLEALFRVPRRAYAAIADDTVVCRCEEVTAGDIRRAVGEGCVGPNQVKSVTRTGMGPCQSRQCGISVPLLTAEALGRSVAEVGPLRPRPPLTPVTLGQLAALAESVEVS